MQRHTQSARAEIPYRWPSGEKTVIARSYRALILNQLISSQSQNTAIRRRGESRSGQFFQQSAFAFSCRLHFVSTTRPDIWSQSQAAESDRNLDKTCGPERCI
eukprot:364241-Chlamydomonas_euryale.AAC.7